ncbi:hypothetical protein [Micromonospora sp. KC213]|uniref:hypothetical protein n=1 Tax=Micromonospora sp. KC213 TaxID=2530378 RepID=UPI001A9EA03D|nr:hypothetical protein [Micromonospora sp. KC213]
MSGRPGVLADPDRPEVDLPEVAGGHDRSHHPPRPSASTEPGDPSVAIGIRLLDAPVNRRDDTRAHRYVVDHLRPGTSIKRRVIVRNRSELPRDATLYAAAADVTDDGFALAPGRTENELSSWIEVTPEKVRLDPVRRPKRW